MRGGVVAQCAKMRRSANAWVGDLKERFCPVVFSKKFFSKINGPIFQNRGGQKRSFLLLFYWEKSVSAPRTSWMTWVLNQVQDDK